MVEIARACVRAARIAEVAEFFSFGTNDLTQGTFSFSREDAENKFLPIYNTEGILRHNPFEILDELGVGFLMDYAVKAGRTTRPDLKIGICGEHGGQPQAVEFCHRIGLNYVSCSPMRIPIARMAAAHAVIKEKKGAGGTLQGAVRISAGKAGGRRPPAFPIPMTGSRGKRATLFSLGS